MLILGAISEGFIKLLVWVVTGIYKIASFTFELFIILASGKIISEDSYRVMIENVYIILGVIMLFIVAFSLLQMMVNPDDQKKGTSSIKKIIINLVTSAIIMAILPTIFTFAYDFQDSFINKYNVIGRFFGYGDIGGTVTSPTDEDNRNIVKTGLYEIVNGVFTAFFNVNFDKCKDDAGNVVLVDSNEAMLNCQKKYEADENQTYEYGVTKGKDADCSTGKSCKHTFASTISEVSYTGKFGYYNDFSEWVDGGEIDFNFIMCLIAGAILIYVGISFCFDMAVRLIKLVFYQLIAPVPIFLRIIPEGKLSGTFKQWAKVTLTCYLEVYIRIFVLYFCIYLCKKMLEADFLKSVAWSFGGLQATFLTAFVLMGIVIFMKQAPKLIGEITGIDSGNMKLGIKEKLKEGGFYAAANAIGGAITSKGNPLGAIRGFKHGWKNADFKGIGAEDTRRKSWEDATGKGARRRDLIKDDIRSAFGFESAAEAAERKVKMGKQNVVNTSGYAVKYTDVDGKEISIGSDESKELDYRDIENLKAQKAKNNGKISTALQKISTIDDLQKWNDNQKSLKSTLETDAKNKWNEGKYTLKVKYKNSEEKVIEENITGQRFEELKKQGVKFLTVEDSLEKYNVSYRGTDGKIHSEKDLTTDEIKVLEAAGNHIIKQDESYYSEDEVQTKANIKWTKHEINNPNGSGAKSAIESFFDKLGVEGGFEYEAFKYEENGKPVRDDNGKQVIGETGKFNSKIQDGVRIITHEITTDSGTKVIEYSDIGGGMYKYTEDGVEKEIDAFTLASTFKKKSDSNKTVLESKKSDIQAKEIKYYEDQNKGIDAIVKQHEEKQEEQLQSSEQRRRNATKTYRGNRN